MPSGGARPGAGRPRKTDKYAAQIAVLEDGIADGLPENLDNMQLLANGGYEQITESWEPAGLIQVTKQVVTNDGTVNVRELAFPELDPTQLVCVRRTRSIAAPDRRANEYLINRIAGTPTQRVELDPDPDGALELTAANLNEAAKELAAWRTQMLDQLNSQSVSPMPPTSATPMV